MIKNILVNTAHAQDVSSTTSAKSAISAGSFIPLILIFGVFSFLIIRPQNKKIKQHQEFVNNLKIGTKVVTNGGVIGVIRDIDKKNNQVEIEISPNVNVRILKNYVSEFVENNETSEDKSSKK